MQFDYIVYDFIHTVSCYFAISGSTCIMLYDFNIDVSTCVVLLESTVYGYICIML